MNTKSCFFLNFLYFIYLELVYRGEILDRSLTIDQYWKNNENQLKMVFLVEKHTLSINKSYLTSFKQYLIYIYI